VGQINIGGYRIAGKCTGTLVASNLVITAARCVWDYRNKYPAPLHDIDFLAGVHGSSNLGGSTAKCLHFIRYDQLSDTASQSAAPVQPLTQIPLAIDAVAIVLNEKLVVGPAHLAQDVIPDSSQYLVHAAYPADRRFQLMAHFGCHLLRSEGSGLWLTDCDTHPACSGGPVFAKLDGEFKLVAIMLAAGPGYNIALPIRSWLGLTHLTSCP
jgi:protease YdgD